MAPFVFELLEMVDIAHEQRRRFARCGDGALQRRIEGLAVRNPCQSVGKAFLAYVVEIGLQLAHLLGFEMFVRSSISYVPAFRPSTSLRNSSGD